MRGKGGGTVIGPHLPLSKFPCNHGLLHLTGLGGNLESALETHCSFYAGLMMFWLSSMFHRNYLTDGPESGLDSSDFASGTGLMRRNHGWVSTIQFSTEKLVLCNHSLQYSTNHSHALLVGRASIAPLTIEGHLWACCSLLSDWVPSHAES